MGGHLMASGVCCSHAAWGPVVCVLLWPACPPAALPPPPPNLSQPVPAAGIAAPLSQSKGPGIDIHPLIFTYPTGGNDVAVHVYDSDSAAAAGLADYVAQVNCGCGWWPILQGGGP